MEGASMGATTTTIISGSTPPRPILRDDDEDSEDDSERPTATTRQRNSVFSGHENDSGVDLFNELAKLRKLCLVTATMLKQAWVPETFRHMKYSWRLLNDFLKEHNYSSADLISPEKAHIKNDFESLTALQFSRSTWLPLCSHVSILLDLFQPSGDKRTALIRRVVKRRSPGTQKKYKTMWDIGRLLNYIGHTYSNNNALTLHGLSIKMVLLVMVFTVCRFPELTRLSIDHRNTSADRLSLFTETKTALDEKTPITLRSLTNATICPVRAVRAWLERTGESGDPLFVDPTTRKPLKARQIGALVRRAFEGAGIPPIYGTYSIKHAVVSFLFGRGVEEWRINAFGRWAPGSHTAATFYRVDPTDDDWLGFRIAQSVQRAPGSMGRI
jgi:hypothetical protein